MNFCWFILGNLLFPFLSESSQKCFKSEGICYAGNLNKSCLQDNAYEGEAMVAHGRVQDLDPAVLTSRNDVINGIISFLRINTERHCKNWKKSKLKKRQIMNIVKDTVCRNHHKYFLPEGPTINSLKTSHQLYCLPWIETAEVEYFPTYDGYCRNPTNSSLGPYCYVSYNVTMPCFVKCVPELDSEIEFKLGDKNSTRSKTNCHSICDSHGMKCNFENFDRLSEKKVSNYMSKMFTSIGHEFWFENETVCGSDVIASKWNYPVYKSSTGCIYGYKYNTFEPECGADIDKSTDYTRICQCMNIKATTQITKAATSQISIKTKNTAPPRKSDSSSQDEKDEKKDTIIIACVLSAFSVVIILLIVASVFIYKRKRSKSKVDPKPTTKTEKSRASTYSKPGSKRNRSSAKSSQKTKTSIKSTAHKTDQQSASVDHKKKQVKNLKVKTPKMDVKSEVQPEIYLKVNGLQNVKKDFKTTKGELKEKGAQSGISLPSRTGTVKVTPLNKPASKSHKGDTLDYENLLPHNFKEKPQFNKITKNSPTKLGDKTLKTSKSRHGDTYDFITPLNFKKKPNLKLALEKHDVNAKTNIDIG